jgi:hypothetical protein
MPNSFLTTFSRALLRAGVVGIATTGRSGHSSRRLVVKLFSTYFALEINLDHLASSHFCRIFAITLFQIYDVATTAGVGSAVGICSFC